MLTKALVCKPDGTREIITINSDDIAKIQEIVSGHFTLVPKILLPGALKGLTVYVNDEGFDRTGKALPFNPLFGPLGLVGTAIITCTNQRGEDKGLTNDQIEALLNFPS